MILHKDGWGITVVIKKSAKLYIDVKVIVGKQHKYLGMDLDYRTD